MSNAQSAVIKSGTFTLLLSAVDIGIATEQSRADAKTLQERNQLILLSAVYHADKHGNTTPLREFLDSVTGAQNITAMTDWLTEYTVYDYRSATPATALKAAKDSKVHKSSRLTTHTQAKNRDKAAAHPYWLLKPSNSKKAAFDAVAFVDRAIKTLTDKKADIDADTRQKLALKLLAASQDIVDQFDAAPVAILEAAPEVLPVVAASKPNRHAASSAARH